MMAVYMDERIVEQKKEDPMKSILTFKYPWIIEISPEMKNKNSFSESTSTFSTKFMYHAAEWRLDLTREHFLVRNPQYVLEEDEFIDGFNVPTLIWNGACFFSYKLYTDNDMSVLLYESPKAKMLDSKEFDSFKSPGEFMSTFHENLNGKKVSKIVLFIELQLPAKYFYLPFTMPICIWRKLFDTYPKNISSDFRFDYLKESDFVIKCIDGSVPATRQLLNLSSEFFKEHFKTSNEKEIFVNYHIDVVEPIVILLHTWCFQMPELFDLDYINRLLEAFLFFEVSTGNNFNDSFLFHSTVHEALCKKFVEEKHTSFSAILEWISITFCFPSHISYDLRQMIAVVIADKFYHEWHQKFPVNARNMENADFRKVFGSAYSSDEYLQIFHEIEDVMKESLLTTVTLP